MQQDLKYINKSLEKSFKILEILSKSIFPLKASNISRKAVLSRTTTFRLLSVLSQLGYIHKNTGTNTYTMGHKAFQFGETSDYLQSISETSKEILKEVSSKTNLITYLAMLEGSQIVHSDKISDNNDDATMRTFRMRLDAHCCALGKVMLAYRPENEIATIYRSYNFYPHTNNTITNLNDLKIKMSLTAPGCPVAGEMPGQVANTLAKIPNVGLIEVELVWEPAWTKDRMSEDAKLALDIY